MKLSNISISCSQFHFHSDFVSVSFNSLRRHLRLSLRCRGCWTSWIAVPSKEQTLPSMAPLKRLLQDKDRGPAADKQGTGITMHWRLSVSVMCQHSSGVNSGEKTRTHCSCSLIVLLGSAVLWSHQNIQRTMHSSLNKAVLLTQIKGGFKPRPVWLG